MNTRKPVAYDDLRGYLKLLEDNGMLVRVSSEVDLDGELGAIAYRDLVRDGPAIWFDNIKNYPGMPLVTNIMYREDQLALALNGDADWANLRDIIHEGMQNKTPCNIVESGPVKEVKIMGEDVDLDILPTPRWHEEDGGRAHVPRQERQVSELLTQTLSRTARETAYRNFSLLVLHE